MNKLKLLCKTLFTVCVLLLLAHRAESLQCYVGSDIKGPNIPSVSQFESGTCPPLASEPQQCLRVEASLKAIAVSQADKDKWIYGECVAASKCLNLDCKSYDQTLKNVNPFTGIKTCTAACCVTDNCNSATVADLNGAALPPTPAAQFGGFPGGFPGLPSFTFPPGFTLPVGPITLVPPSQPTGTVPQFTLPPTFTFPPGLTIPTNPPPSVVPPTTTTTTPPPVTVNGGAAGTSTTAAAATSTAGTTSTAVTTSTPATTSLAGPSNTQTTTQNVLLTTILGMTTQNSTTVPAGSSSTTPNQSQGGMNITMGTSTTSFASTIHKNIEYILLFVVAQVYVINFC